MSDLMHFYRGRTICSPQGPTRAQRHRVVTQWDSMGPTRLKDLPANVEEVFIGPARVDLLPPMMILPLNQTLYPSTKHLLEEVQGLKAHGHRVSLEFRMNPKEASDFQVARDIMDGIARLKMDFSLHRTLLVLQGPPEDFSDLQHVRWIIQNLPPGSLVLEVPTERLSTPGVLALLRLQELGEVVVRFSTETPQQTVDTLLTSPLPNGKVLIGTSPAHLPLLDFQAVWDCVVKRVFTPTLQPSSGPETPNRWDLQGVSLPPSPPTLVDDYHHAITGSL